jgi:hypothetical protein
MAYITLVNDAVVTVGGVGDGVDGGNDRNGDDNDDEVIHHVGSYRR